MKLVPTSLNEIQNFKRGLDPKKSMDIGLSTEIKKITSDDLERLGTYWEGPGTVPNDAEFADCFYIEGEDEENEDILRDVKKLYYILKDHIEYGETFDWKQSDAMEIYIKEQVERRNPPVWVYTASPGSDQDWVVFSDIHLPNCEEIKFKI